MLRVYVYSASKTVAISETKDEKTSQQREGERAKERDSNSKVQRLVRNGSSACACLYVRVTSVIGVGLSGVRVERAY